MKKIFTLLLAVLSLISLASCGARPEDNRVVMTLDGEKIHYDYYRYVFLQQKDDLDTGKEGHFDSEEARKELNDAVLHFLRLNQARKELASDYKIKLTSEDKEEIKQYKNDIIDGYGKNGYESMLDEAYMSEYVLSYMKEIEILWRKLYDHVTSEENGIILASDSDIEKDIEKNFWCYRYVLIYDNDKKKEGEALDIASNVKKLADEGNNFAELIEKYGEDDPMKAKKDSGYYFTVGEIAKNVEDIVKALPENGISDVIDMGYGYFVVQRLPKDTDYINKNFNSMREKYRARIFNEMVEAKAQDIKIEYKDLYNKLSIDSIK